MKCYKIDTKLVKVFEDFLIVYDIKDKTFERIDNKKLFKSMLKSEYEIKNYRYGIIIPHHTNYTAIKELMGLIFSIDKITDDYVMIEGFKIEKKYVLFTDTLICNPFRVNEYVCAITDIRFKLTKNHLYKVKEIYDSITIIITGNNLRDDAFSISYFRKTNEWIKENIEKLNVR